MTQSARQDAAIAASAAARDPQPIVWRGLTAAEVQQQCDMRLAVPDGPRFISDWAERSAAIRDRLPGDRDIRYGSGPRQLLDVYSADGAAARAVMFVHGGAWSALSREVCAYVAEPLVSSGIAVVIPSYDLHPQADMATMMREIREAIIWCAGNLSRYGIAAGQLTLCGHSAGGQLAGMALAHDFRRDGLAGAPFRAAMLISSCHHLEPHRHHPRYRDMGFDEAMVLQASPACNPPLDTDLPLVIAVGGAETAEYRRQAQEFAERCRARGHPVRHLEVPGAHHFSIASGLGEVDNILTRALIELALA